MSRPEHIAALDEVLEQALDSVSAADTKVADFYRDHIGVIDEETRVLQERADVHHTIGQTSDAIRKLGYVLPSGVQERIDETPNYNANDDKEAARNNLSYNA